MINLAERKFVDQLVAETKSKYALVVATARRGRALMEGVTPLVQVQSTKPVTMALEEIMQGAVEVDVQPAGIK